MAIPWRAAEAMHWQMGEHEMARRAGVTPFSLANNNGGTIQHPPLPRPLARSNSGHGSSAHLRTHSGPDAGPLQLPSLAELTAGLPAFVPPPAGYTSQPSTPYEFPTRQSLPPGYERYQPNGRHMRPPI